METIVTDGVTYTKASVLAKRFHYTSDYVGQLCRAEKADCQLVGRSWYVNENSLIDHKESRYREIRLSEKTSKIRVNLESDEAVKVYPRVNAKEVRRDIKRDLNAFASVPLSIATYETDLSPLVPQPLKKITPKIPIPVELESPERIKISSSSPESSVLEFTDMPEVSLSGILPVVSAELDITASLPVTEVDLTPEVPQPLKMAQEHTKPRAVPFAEKIRRVSEPPAPSVSFTPTTVVTVAKKSNWFVLVAVVLSACVLSGFFMLSSHEILVGRFDVSSRVVLTTSALSAITAFWY